MYNSFVGEVIRPCFTQTNSAFSRPFTPKKDSCVRSNHAWSFSAFVHSYTFLGHCMTNGDYPGIVLLLPNPSTAPENNSGPGAVHWVEISHICLDLITQEEGRSWFQLNMNWSMIGSNWATKRWGFQSLLAEFEILEISWLKHNTLLHNLY